MRVYKWITIGTVAVVLVAEMEDTAIAMGAMQSDGSDHSVSRVPILNVQVSALPGNTVSSVSPYMSNMVTGEEHATPPRERKVTAILNPNGSVTLLPARGRRGFE